MFPAKRRTSMSSQTRGLYKKQSKQFASNNYLQGFSKTIQLNFFDH